MGVAMSSLGKSLFGLVLLALWGGSAGAGLDVPLAALEVSENSDNPQILAALALKYEHAEGVPLDYLKAKTLYCRAARSGHAGAQYALGWMYANGRGVSRDDGVAARLFAMAAEQGHEYATRMMRFTQTDVKAQLPACLLPDTPVVQDEDSSQEVAVTFQDGPISRLVHQLAPRYEVDPRLVMAVISVESGFNARAISPKNAQGLMQLIPETAQRFRVKNTFDPAENIKGGMAYLQWLLAFFKGDVSLVVAAYNAGERAVERYRGIPPYPETRDYVRKIKQLYRKPTHPYQSNLVESSFVALPVN
jgi:soluble lytic murein transglycosylase-like protein